MADRANLPGKIVKANEIGTIIGSPISLNEEAARIIRRAEEAGEKVRRLAAQERANLKNFLRDISDKELQKFINTEAAKSATASFSAVLDATAVMKRDFDSMQPWLVTLIDSALRRIIGELEDADLFARVVAQALAEVDPGTCSNIRAGKIAFPKMSEARRKYPEKFDGIHSIRCDETLAPDALYLECNVGLSEITVETQMDALARLLSQPQPQPASTT